MSKSDILVLGPVQAWAAGRRIPLDGSITESLLAALVIDADRVVTLEALVDIGWEFDPPRTVRRQIRNRLARLRRALIDAGFPPGVIGVEGNGYMLNTDGIHLDLAEFRRMSLAGADLSGNGFRAALSLWRGPAFAGLESSRLLAVADRLAEERFSLWEQCLGLELQAGKHEAAIADLVGLHRMHPARERFARLLMLALYRSGRRADALDVFRTTRKHLAEELGLSPGEDLQTLHQDILREKADLHLAAADGRTAGQPDSTAGITAGKTDGNAAGKTGGSAEGKTDGRTTVVPQELPRDVAHFTGRAETLARMDEWLSEEAVSIICGTGGVGKTALTVHWAYRVRERFPDGQLYVNLRGFDPSATAMTAAEAVRRFLESLGVPPPRIPADPQAQVNLYRTLLADRRMLVLLDNAGDPDQIRPLLPGAPGCLVLVTSRYKLTGLIAAEGARLLPLDVLTLEDSRDLLIGRLGPARVLAEPGAVDELITACARLPLALAIVVAIAATDPRRPLTVLADQLRHSRHRLDALSTNDTSVTDLRAVFSWSYLALNEEAARLFRLLGLHPGPDISVAAAASLAALPVDKVLSLLRQLAGAHLIDEHVPGRYTFHDLLRAYAAELVRGTDPDRHLREATGRMLDHYLHSADVSARQLLPTVEATAFGAARSGVVPEHPADHDQALEWFTAEHAVLLAAIDHAAAHGYDSYTWRLALAINVFLSRRGHWANLETVSKAAASAAGRLADPVGKGRAHRLIARVHLTLGHLEDATKELRLALDLFSQAGDPAWQSETHLTFGHVWERQGRPGVALIHAEQALRLSRAARKRRSEALALNAVGWCHALLGNYDQTLVYCGQALDIHQEHNDHGGQASVWDSIAYAHHHSGDTERALACHRQALALFREIGDRLNEADSLGHLGDTHFTAGDRDAAREAWQLSLTILDQLGHPDADLLRAKLAESAVSSAVSSTRVGAT